MQVVVGERISKKKKRIFLVLGKKAEHLYSVFSLVIEGDKVYSQYLNIE